MGECTVACNDLAKANWQCIYAIVINEKSSTRIFDQ